MVGLMPVVCRGRWGWVGSWFLGGGAERLARLVVSGVCASPRHRSGGSTVGIGSPPSKMPVERADGVVGALLALWARLRLGGCCVLWR